MSEYADARAQWLELEELKTMKPSGCCGKCGTPTAGALCSRCDGERLNGLVRFASTIGKQKHRRRYTAAREEWTPYKDSEDRR